MKAFGLTGNIASGKSTVSRTFTDEGIAVVDADAISHRVTGPGTEGLQALVAAFGPDMLTRLGELDRKKLGARVFADRDARTLLNSIVHPRIAAATRQRFIELDKLGVQLACYDAALLVENHMQDAFRPLVVVTVPEDVQLTRLMARNGLTRDEALERISSQMPQAKKAAAADIVINNDSDLATLEMRAKHALEEVRRRLSTLDMLL